MNNYRQTGSGKTYSMGTGLQYQGNPDPGKSHFLRFFLVHTNGRMDVSVRPIQKKYISDRRCAQFGKLISAQCLLISTMHCATCISSLFFLLLVSYSYCSQSRTCHLSTAGCPNGEGSIDGIPSLCIFPGTVQRGVD